MEREEKIITIKDKIMIVQDKITVFCTQNKISGNENKASNPVWPNLIAAISGIGEAISRLGATSATTQVSGEESRVWNVECLIPKIHQPS